MKSALVFLGDRCLRALAYTGSLGLLFLDVVWWVLPTPGKSKGRIRYDETLLHMKRVGVRSAGIVATVIFFVGMIVAFQMVYVLESLGVTEYVADITGVAMVREMGPLLVGMVMTGYAGAAIAAEIGTMVVSEEVLALETFSLDPVRFLVVPRVLAAMIMLPCVCLVATYIGIAGGFFVGYFLLGMEAEKYLQRTFDAIQFKDVATGLIKAEAFGTLMAIIACKEGLEVKKGAEGVGLAATRAVVRCIVAIILCDLVFTAFFYFFF